MKLTSLMLLPQTATDCATVLCDTEEKLLQGVAGVGCGVVTMFWLESTFLTLLFLDLDLDVLPSTGPQEQRRGSLMPWVLAA